MSRHTINHPILGPGFECPPPMTFTPRPPCRVDVLALLDQAARTIYPLSKSSGDGDDQLAGLLRYEARAALAELIEAAKAVGCSYCDPDSADRLTAALARIGAP